MKLIKTLSVFLMVIILTNYSFSQQTTNNSNPDCNYCTAPGGFSDQTGVNLVNFNTINNATPTTTAGYMDFTTISTTVTKGTSYNLTVNVNTGGPTGALHTFAWIDWNQDCDFTDIGEAYDLGTAINVVNGISSLCPLSITIPVTSTTGTTRMRVYTRFNADPSSCGAFTYSEAEDYTINVIAPTIVVNPVSLDFGDVVLNQNSIEKSFTVLGSYLTDNIVITAPNNFQISTTSGSGYTNTITLTQSGGNVPLTTIYVIFSPTVAQTYTGNITNVSTTAIPNVAVSGTGINQTYTISISTLPIGAGVVTGNGTYTENSNVMVTASANAGYTFLNWTEGTNVVSTDANYTFLLTSNRNLVANFSLNTYNISVSANPQVAGNVTGGNTYNYNQSATLTATANTGYTFVNWTEGANIVSIDSTYSFQVTSERVLVANFSINSYNISVSAVPTDGGNVTGGNTYNYNQSATVEATTNTGYNFMNWTEGTNIVSTNLNYTFTVTANRTLVANFQAIQKYDLNIVVNGSGTTTPTTGIHQYYENEVVDLTATADANYKFDKWKVGIQEYLTNNIQITMDADKTATAYFSLNNEITNAAENKINISPNPTNGIFNIQFTGFENKDFEVVIKDLTGRTILKSKNNIIDLTNKTAGIYIVKIMIDNKIYESKIIKK